MSKKPNLKRTVAYANYMLGICITQNCSCMEAGARIFLDTLIGEPENHRANIMALGGTMEDFAAGCRMVEEVEQRRDGKFGVFGVISARWVGDDDIEIQYAGVNSVEDIV